MIAMTKDFFEIKSQYPASAVLNKGKKKTSESDDWKIADSDSIRFLF